MWDGHGCGFGRAVAGRNGEQVIGGDGGGEEKLEFVYSRSYIVYRSGNGFWTPRQKHSRVTPRVSKVVFEVEVGVPGIFGVFAFGKFERVALQVGPMQLDGGKKI